MDSSRLNVFCNVVTCRSDNDIFILQTDKRNKINFERESTKRMCQNKYNIDVNLARFRIRVPLHAAATSRKSTSAHSRDHRRNSIFKHGHGSAF